MAIAIAAYVSPARNIVCTSRIHVNQGCTRGRCPGTAGMGNCRPNKELIDAGALA
jgi:hypothetical protein